MHLQIHRAIFYVEQEPSRVIIISNDTAARVTANVFTDYVSFARHCRGTGEKARRFRGIQNIFLRFLLRDTYRNSLEGHWVFFFFVANVET